MRFLLLYFFAFVFSKQTIAQAVSKNQLHNYLSESEEWWLKLDTSYNFIFHVPGIFELMGKYTLTDSTISFKCDSNYIKDYLKYFNNRSITKSLNAKNVFYGNSIKRNGNYLIPDTYLCQQENNFKLLSGTVGNYHFFENFLININKDKSYYLMGLSCSPRMNKESIEKGTWSKQGDFIILKPRKNKQRLHNLTFVENKLFFNPYFLVAKQPIEFYTYANVEGVQEIYNYILKSGN